MEDITKINFKKCYICGHYMLPHIDIVQRLTIEEKHWLIDLIGTIPDREETKNSNGKEVMCTSCSREYLNSR